MIGTSSESNGQVADLVFVVEGTANMGAYLGELRANYIVPTLEYFNGGSSKEEKDYGSELNSTMYALVVFMAADIAPESAVSCVASPTTCINKFLGWLDRVPFLGGAAEGSSHISEGLGAALQAFDDFQVLREPHLTTQKHCILICNSPPYPLPCLESVNYAGMMCEQLAARMGERNINLSIISPRKIPALLKIYDKSSGDLQMAQNKNYTKDRRHLVLLKGYHLQERPLSPTSVDIKEKLPIPTSTLPIDTKPILPPSNLMPVGSPGSNNLISKGKKRNASPPNQPPFKMANQGTIGGVGTMGMNSMQSQGSQLLNSQATTMSTASTNSPQMSYIQIGVQPQMNMPSGLRQMGPTGMPLNRLAPPQTSPSFMNQPNPPNVTITKGPPLPVINSQPMDTTAMGRPIRDPNPNSQVQRMIWNPPQRPQMSSGQTGNAANPMPGMGINNPGMSSLVSRLNQPTRGNGGIMTGPRPPGPDMMNSMTRSPNVNTVNSATMNTPGQANLVGMLQQGNIGPGGPNHLHQNPAIQTNMMHGNQKNMNNQMNMNTLGSVANIPNQVGGQQPSNQIQQMGNNPSIMTSQQSTGVQMGNQPTQLMQSTGQLPGQQNVIGGQIPQSIPGPISQMNNMGAASGQGSMIQGQVLNQTMLNQANNQQPPMQQQQQQPQQRKEKAIIWQGIIEWQEKPKTPNDPNGKVNRQVPCQVSSTVNAMGEPEVNAEKWPNKLIMQLIPKVLMHQFGNTFLKMARNVIFYFGKGADTAEALASLNKVMSTGFVGCVHFSSQQNMNCDIRILMLVYGNDMHSYIGFIPNDQTGFVATIRNVITKKQQNAKQQQQGGVMPQQPQQQMFGLQPGQSNLPINPGMNLPIAGPTGGGAGGLGGPGNVLPGSLNPNQATTGPPSNLLPSTVTGANSGVPLGQNGPAVAGRNSPNPQLQTAPVPGNRNVPQSNTAGTNQQCGNVDPNVERQQNLLKIEQLRQSLIAAQQKEVQFKAAQEQQQHHVPPPLRQSDLLLLQQLQQQQQQQPRLLANNASNANNPQLRQLLQISQQLQMMQNQQGGPRSGGPEMGQGPGSGQPQPPNTGSNMFPDDIFLS